MFGKQSIFYIVGLPKSERAFAGSDSNFGLGHKPFKGRLSDDEHSTAIN